MNGNAKGTLLVTGGSRGIGAAIALEAGRSGYAVCVNYLNELGAAETIVEQIKVGGGHAIAFNADVSDETAVAEMFDTAATSLGPIRALVNNAGVSGARGRFLEIEVRELRRILDTNLWGAMLCAREAVRHMKASPDAAGGAIVNLSSQVVRNSGANLAAYTASKAGLEGLAQALSKELARDGIRINTVSPGIIETDQNPVGDDATRSKMEQTIPLGRIGSVYDVANTVLWLLSNKASYITGTVITVAGGR